MPITKSTDLAFKKISIKPVHLKNAETLYFSSIITEFSDTWNPNWSTNTVYGRMDPISFYSNTTRELTLGFRVISDDKHEAEENMRKVQKLIQYQYPYYKSHGGVQLLTAPPYFKFQFMNVISDGGMKELSGYINGAVQINPGFQSKEQSQYFAEGNQKIYFSDITITLKLQVLHEGNVGFTDAGFIKGEQYPYGAIGNPPANVAANSDPAPEDGTPTDSSENSVTDSTDGKPDGGATLDARTARAATLETSRRRLNVEPSNLGPADGTASTNTGSPTVVTIAEGAGTNSTTNAQAAAAHRAREIARKTAEALANQANAAPGDDLPVIPN